VVPGNVAWMQQLLNDEPTHDIMGPFEATYVNSKAANTPFEFMEIVLGADLTA
jgi:hypothetical protein